MARLLFVCLGLLLGGVAFGREDAAKDREKLQGLWQAVHLEYQGKKAPPKEVEMFVIRIKGDKLTFGPGADDRTSTFFLDPTKKPKAMDLRPEDGPAKGKRLPVAIYAIEGDTLKLCLDKEDKGGGRPKEFKTRAGDGLALLVFKRVKK
jgi:uncharacterized protein (TIGR03067 family)